MKDCSLYSLLLLCLLLISSCKSYRENAKYGLNEGYYKSRIEGMGDRRVYVYATEDTLVAFPQIGRGGNRRVDTTARAAMAFPSSLRGRHNNTLKLTFRKCIRMLLF